MLLARLIYLKPKVYNIATISAFRLFFVTWIFDPIFFINPGLRHNSRESFSICHWDLNSVSACSYTKVSSLKVFIAVHKFDVICLSETYLDSSNATDDENLEILGYSLVRSDHPSNNKRGGTCAYYKIFLPFWCLPVFTSKQPSSSSICKI